MCRIVGYWDYKNRDGGEYLRVMRDSMQDGGPDDAGEFCDEHQSLHLGHRRLSILDLSPLGHQPMIYENLVISYNGEVYNYKEIRNELIGLGYSFKSDCDTEVIIKAYHKWGKDSFQKFRGMFAFAIWDKFNQKLLLVRDRMGVKPLYYYHKENIFIFGSELKGFYKHPEFKKIINKNGLGSYLKYGSVENPFTIFEDTYQLKPGEYLEINRNQKVEKVIYWDASDYIRSPKVADSFDISKTKVTTLLKESISLRMISDVPLGIFLSSGTDSALVASIMQSISSRPIRTFTIGFEEKKFNEANDAKTISTLLGTDHTDKICSGKDALDVVPLLSKVYSEPFADSSAIPTLLVSSLAKSKVSVSLSADGGDEFFYGYPRYRQFEGPLSMLSASYVNKIPELCNKFLKKDFFHKLGCIVKEQDLSQKYDLLMSYFMPDEIEKLIGKTQTTSEKIGDIDIKSDFLTMKDIRRYLPSTVLHKVDRATMSVSLEGREPLLDHKLAEYALTMPLEYKYVNGTSKYILKKILENYIPKDLIYKPKKGFSVPVGSWLKGDLRGITTDMLSEKKIKQYGILNSDFVQSLVQNFYSGKSINPYKIWVLLMFQMWCEEHM